MATHSTVVGQTGSLTIVRASTGENTDQDLSFEVRSNTYFNLCYTVDDQNRLSMKPYKALCAYKHGEMIAKDKRFQAVCGDLEGRVLTVTINPEERLRFPSFSFSIAPPEEDPPSGSSDPLRKLRASLTWNDQTVPATCVLRVDQCTMTRYTSNVWKQVFEENVTYDPATEPLGSNRGCTHPRQPNRPGSKHSVGVIYTKRQSPLRKEVKMNEYVV